MYDMLYEQTKKELFSCIVYLFCFYKFFEIYNVYVASASKPMQDRFICNQFKYEKALTCLEIAQHRAWTSPLTIIHRDTHAHG